MARAMTNTVFLIPGIIPLVPGGGIYWTAYYIVTDPVPLNYHIRFPLFLFLRINAVLRTTESP